MKTYLNPEISVVRMNVCDVIATSGALVDGGIQVNSKDVNATTFDWGLLHRE